MGNEGYVTSTSRGSWSGPSRPCKSIEALANCLTDHPSPHLTGQGRHQSSVLSFLLVRANGKVRSIFSRASAQHDDFAPCEQCFGMWWFCFCASKFGRNKRQHNSARENRNRLASPDTFPAAHPHQAWAMSMYKNLDRALFTSAQPCMSMTPTCTSRRRATSSYFTSTAASVAGQ